MGGFEQLPLGWARQWLQQGPYQSRGSISIICIHEEIFVSPKPLKVWGMYRCWVSAPATATQLIVGFSVIHLIHGGRPSSSVSHRTYCLAESPSSLGPPYCRCPSPQTRRRLRRPASPMCSRAQGPRRIPGLKPRIAFAMCGVDVGVRVNVYEFVKKQSLLPN